MSSLKSEKSKKRQTVVDADEAWMAMCVGALALSHTSVRCRACEGYGFRELSVEDLKARQDAIAAETDAAARQRLRDQLTKETTCQVCLGCGYTKQRRADRASAMDSMFTTVRCGRCRGCGESMPPSDASAEREDQCWACHGDAYIVPVSVRAKGSSYGSSSSTSLDSGDYVRAETMTAEQDPYVEGRIEELVDQRRAGYGLVEVLSGAPELEAPLASYLGADGDRWVNHRWGRAFALWAHTAAAQQLVAHLAEMSSLRAGFLEDTTTLLAGAREQLERGQLANTRDGAMTRVLLGRVHAEARGLLQRIDQALAEVKAVA